jgi:hypothetical protein
LVCEAMTCSFYVAGGNIVAARLKNKMAGINLSGGDFHMRLAKFADPSPHTLSPENVANLLKRLEGVWPNDELHQRLATVIPRAPCRLQHRRRSSSYSQPRSVMPVRLTERPLVFALRPDRRWLKHVTSLRRMDREDMPSLQGNLQRSGQSETPENLK